MIPRTPKTLGHEQFQRDQKSENFKNYKNSTIDKTSGHQTMRSRRTKTSRHGTIKHRDIEDIEDTRTPRHENIKKTAKTLEH